jgi:hypothetical protein
MICWPFNQAELIFASSGNAQRDSVNTTECGKLSGAIDVWNSPTLDNLF